MGIESLQRFIEREPLRCGPTSYAYDRGPSTRGKTGVPGVRAFRTLVENQPLAQGETFSRRYLKRAYP
jgi:hypothetical protein